jgi:galactonate dehydratase
MMRIARIESFPVPPRWIFVRLETEDGLVGWGEAIVPKRVRAVRGAIADLAENLMGAPSDAIEDAWQRMFRGAFFRRGPILMTAIAAIEQALWDVKGKRYGLPIYEFFGGRVRERIKAYAWVGGDIPEEVVSQAQIRQAQGYQAVKMNATGPSHYLADYAQIDGVIERVAALRSAMGPHFGIALDFHGRVHRAMVKTLLTELRPYRLLWVEEPLLPEHGDQLRDLASIPIPLAAGERLMDRWDYKTVLEQRALAIIQPDVSFTGIHELEKIARMAEAYDVVVAPHCPNGTISLAATLAVLGAIPNAVWQEHSRGLHYHQGYQSLPPGELEAYLTDPQALDLKDGYLPILSTPGLGIAVNEEAVRAPHPDWTLSDPTWRNADGTLAEW